MNEHLILVVSAANVTGSTNQQTKTINHDGTFEGIAKACSQISKQLGYNTIQTVFDVEGCISPDLGSIESKMDDDPECIECGLPLQEYESWYLRVCDGCMEEEI